MRESQFQEACNYCGVSPETDHSGHCIYTKQKETQEYFEWLKSPSGGSCVACKEFGDFYGAVKPLLFHWTFIIGIIGDKCSWLDNFCYQTREQAVTALNAWDGVGEPSGWHRNPRTGRRRPIGDASREYVSW